jgi:hypothetical protein
MVRVSSGLEAKHYFAGWSRQLVWLDSVVA